MASFAEKMLNKVYDILVFFGMSLNIFYRFIKNHKDLLIKKYTYERLGRINVKLIADKNVYWIHAVSVGEVGAAKIIARDLKQLDDKAYVIVTVFTLTGYEETKKFPDLINESFFCPIDTSYFIKKFINKINPIGLIIIDGDFWAKMILETKKNNIPIFVVNAKLSQKSARNYSNLQHITKKVFSSITKIYAQNKEYAKRFEFVGVSRENITICGNVKNSVTPQVVSDEQLSSFKQRYNLTSNNVISFNSIHPEEIPIISKAIEIIKEIKPSLDIIITPRHPIKYTSPKSLNDNFLEKNISFFSDSENDVIRHNGIVWINKMGILPFVYSCSKIALIGGTFSQKIGGHNIIEPCFYNVPSMYGPYTHTQKALKSIAKKFNVGHEVQSAKDIATFVDMILANPKEYDNIQERIAIMKIEVSSISINITKNILKTIYLNRKDKQGL